MNNVIARLALGVLLSHSIGLAAFAQGDPVVTPTITPTPQPKVEIQQPTNNPQVLFQNNTNTPAVQFNQSISPLDQRNSLIQNAFNTTNMFGLNGLGTNSITAPKINNSQLIANPTMAKIGGPTANFLLQTDPKANIDRELIPRFNNLSTAALISALALALNVPENVLMPSLAKANQGQLESARSQLVSLSVAVKTGKVKGNEAQQALLKISQVNQPTMTATQAAALTNMADKMRAEANANVSSSVTQTTTQTSSNIQSKPSFDGLAELLNNLAKLNATQTQTQTQTTSNNPPKVQVPTSLEDAMKSVNTGTVQTLNLGSIPGQSLNNLNANNLTQDQKNMINSTSLNQKREEVMNTMTNFIDKMNSSKEGILNNMH